MKTARSLPPSVLLPIVCSVYFLYFACSFLDRPGYFPDEFIFAPVSLHILGERGIPVQIGHTLFGAPLTYVPLYCGALKAYLMAPVIALFGTGLEALRLPMILLALATALGVWLFARRRIGEWPAAALLVLMTADPAFIFQAKVDWGPMVLGNLFKLLAVALFIRFVERPGTGRAAALLAACAFGLWDKSNFAFFMIALGVAGPVFFARPILAWAGERPLRTAALILPFAGLYALMTLGMMLPYRTYGDAREPLTWDRLVEHWRHVHDVMITTFSGTAQHGFMFGSAVGVPSFAPWLFMAAVLGGLLLGAAGVLGAARRTPASVWLGFFSLLALALYAVMAVVPQAGGLHHLIMLYPLPHIVLVLLAVTAAQSFGSGGRLPVRVAGTALAVAVIALTAAGTRVAAAYRDAFAGTAFNRIMDPALPGVRDILRAERPDRVLALGWGLETTLELLASPDERREYRGFFGSFAGPIENPDFLPWFASAQMAGRRSAVVIYAEEEPMVKRNLELLESKLPACAAATGDRIRVVPGIAGKPLYEIRFYDLRPSVCALAPG